MTGMSISWQPRAVHLLADDLDDVLVDPPAGRQPAPQADPTCRTSPARTISLCDSASASAGGWRSVGSSSWERRAIARRTLMSRPTTDPTNQGAPMAYEVPPLPYDYNALEPTIDEATMKLHHDKHHQAYVDKANDAVAGTELEGMPIEEALASIDKLPEDKRTPFRNNGGATPTTPCSGSRCRPAAAASPAATWPRRSAPRSVVRRLQVAVRGQRRRPVRLRLDLARPRWRRAQLTKTPNQDSRSSRPDPAAGQRRVGARLLPDVQQPPPGLPQGVVGRRQLGRRSPSATSRQVAPAATSRKTVGWR